MGNARGNKPIHRSVIVRGIVTRSHPNSCGSICKLWVEDQADFVSCDLIRSHLLCSNENRIGWQSYRQRCFSHCTESRPEYVPGKIMSEDDELTYDPKNLRKLPANIPLAEV